MSRIREKNNGLILVVQVKTNTKENKIELDDNRIILHITASPVKGKANKSVIQFLSKYFHISNSHFSIISGSKSKSKKILISEINQEDKSRIRHLVDK